MEYNKYLMGPEDEDRIADDDDGNEEPRLEEIYDPSQPTVE